MLLQGAIQLRRPLRPTDVSAQRAGAGVLFAFRPNPTRPTFLEGAERLFALSLVNDSFEFVRWTGTRQNLRLERFPAASVQAAHQAGALRFTVRIPVSAVLGTKAPNRFLFNAWVLGIPGSSTHVAGQSVFAVFRPYTWATVELAARQPK